MKVLLEGLLPRWFPGWQVGQHFLCVAHQGKSDLDSSVPRKLKAWQYPGDRFVVVRDNDNADCQALKRRLLQTCESSGRPDTLVRLVCQELEAWYLGDLQAVAMAFDAPKLDSPAQRKKFDQPDGWQKPSVELARMVPSFQKGSGARRMGQALRAATHNRSVSFQQFESGVRRIALELEWLG
ncbi:hypothetical protein HNQ51_002917 [Inhella inkyongensis]|uniref:DUF4276 family protein n=1 Tax=Inhella inkyongensis TaxID=392593 RepID=A0A840SB56_9BURK|nr:DUF4276 family protein [Inhella inkyongensis]MBB5205590.1 hypothetical protein [Inhella inkyongensis]